ncbi:MAG: M56 family metallopeptidase [Oscillospiraceae bacterium]|nr:M56 family metallopeptidase [Oscillospiraceae bacterium]
MEAVFLRLLNMELSAALVILAVLLVRLLLRRAPKKWSYLLWGVVAFRLICPVSINAPFSVLGLTAQGAAVTGSALGAASAIAYLPRNIGIVTPPRVGSGMGAVSQAALDALPAATQTTGADPMQVWRTVGAALWCAGMIALLVYGAVTYLHLRKRLTGAVLVANDMYETDAVRAPFILGLVRPRIYLPVGLEGEPLRYVLAHERFHIRHGDHAVKLLAFLLLCVHWFDPLVWLAFSLMGRDMEMRCDEAVLAAEHGIAKPYSMALLSFATARRFPSPSPLAFGETGVKQRIQNALRWRQPKVWVTVLCALLCAVAVAACAVNPDPPEPDSEPGAYSDLEAYLRAEIQRRYEQQGVQMYSPDLNPVQIAVVETQIASLEQTGALEGLAPEGRLESWRYRVLLKLPEDAPEHLLVGGMFEEDGWLCLDGEHDVVALRQADGRMRVLYDAQVNDGSTFYGYHNSYEEAIYDWYVSAFGLELPLYVQEWVGGFSVYGNLPVHRYDGDGWYIYIPVFAWNLEEASDLLTKWVSAYGTGSTLVVRRASAEEYAAERPKLTDGQAETWFRAREDGYWLVFTQFDPKVRALSSWAAMEPELLQRMADSFCVTDAAPAAADAETGALIVELLNADGAYAEGAEYRLFQRLLASPLDPLEAVGAYPEGIRAWLCWSLSGELRYALESGRISDADAMLPDEPLPENSAAAWDQMIEFVNSPSPAPKNWRQVYRDFFQNTLLPSIAEDPTDRKLYGVALMDLNFDGVPELMVWDSVASGAATGRLYQNDGTLVATTSMPISTNIRSGRRNEQPFPIEETWAFWLVRERSTGSYFWAVHSGNGQDGHVWGRYLVFDGNPTEIAAYDSSDKADQRAAWQAFDARYEVVDLDDSAFTLSLYEDGDIDAARFNALLNRWRPVTVTENASFSFHSAT